jgi:hypothetical protein
VANTDISQSDNVVGGDQAGRDINKPTVINYGLDSSGVTQIAKLIEKFRIERAGDQLFQQTVEKLEHYSAQPVDVQFLSLEEKLDRGGCAGQLRFAKETKELFTKKLVQFQYFESAQKIHAFLLAEIYSRFHRFVSPLIAEGAPTTVINHVVQEDVLAPILALLGDNDLEIYSDEINGMLYFLTGNCHIFWHKC